MGSPFGRQGYNPVATSSGIAMSATVPGGNTGNLPQTRGDVIGANVGLSAGSAGDIIAGKVSVSMTMAMIGLLIAWYIYTHNIQGGG